MVELSNVTKLVTDRSVRQEHVVKNLEELLERAKKGEYDSMLVVAEGTNGDLWWHYSGTNSTAKLFGYLKMLEHWLAHHFFGNDDGDAQDVG